jgi:hypothetical protein
MPTSSLACFKLSIYKLLSIEEMKAKDPSYFYEEKQPHHSHMSNRKSPEVTKCLVQNVVTGVEAWCYQNF